VAARHTVEGLGPAEVVAIVGGALGQGPAELQLGVLGLGPRGLLLAVVALQPVLDARLAQHLWGGGEEGEQRSVSHGGRGFRQG
jgi:hypothetical protein